MNADVVSQRRESPACVINHDYCDGGLRLMQQISVYRDKVVSAERLSDNGTASMATIPRRDDALLAKAAKNVCPERLAGRPLRRVLLGSCNFTYPFGRPLVCRYHAVLVDGHQHDVLPEQESMAVEEIAADALPPFIKTVRGRLDTRGLRWLSAKEIFLLRGRDVPPMWPLIVAPGAPLFFQTAHNPGKCFVNFYELVRRKEEPAHA